MIEPLAPKLRFEALMHRLVPEFIQERFAEEETAGSFSAGVLFVDISGFTSMAEALMSYGQENDFSILDSSQTTTEQTIHMSTTI